MVEPDFEHYPDTGCEESPACLSCPLPFCKYDDLVAYLKFKRQQRDLGVVLEINQKGLSIAEAAGQFGITPCLASRACSVVNCFCPAMFTPGKKLLVLAGTGTPPSVSAEPSDVTMPKSGSLSAQTPLAQKTRALFGTGGQPQESPAPIGGGGSIVRCCSSDRRMNTILGITGRQESNVLPFVSSRVIVI